MDKLDPKTTAILLVDLQKGILVYPFAPRLASDVQAASVKLLAAARSAGALTVFTRVVYAPTFADALQQPVDKPMTGGALPVDWAEFPDELGVTANDVVIEKRQWGAFYGTDLDLQLRRRGIKTIVLGGIATNMGVESTARDAWEHNYNVVFADETISSLSAPNHNFAMTEIFPLIGQVRSLEDILSNLK